MRWSAPPALERDFLPLDHTTNVEEVLVSVPKLLVGSNFSFTVHNLHELLSLLSLWR